MLLEGVPKVIDTSGEYEIYLRAFSTLTFTLTVTDDQGTVLLTNDYSLSRDDEGVATIDLGLGGRRRQRRMRANNGSGNGGSSGSSTAAVNGPVFVVHTFLFGDGSSFTIQSSVGQSGQGGKGGKGGKGSSSSFDTIEPVRRM